MYILTEHIAERVLANFSELRNTLLQIEP
jgi:hypothetical protein